MGRCPYGRIQTGVVHNADTIVFYGSIGGTRNPMLLPFNTWPVRRQKASSWHTKLNDH